jgi:hypothetical protein
MISTRDSNGNLRFIDAATNGNEQSFSFFIAGYQLCSALSHFGQGNMAGCALQLLAAGSALYAGVTPMHRVSAGRVSVRLSFLSLFTTGSQPTEEKALESSPSLNCSLGF